MPELVGALAEEWSLTVGRVFADGTEALVAEARCADGTAAVLREDVARGALLLERLGGAHSQHQH